MKRFSLLSLGLAATLALAQSAGTGADAAAQSAADALRQAAGTDAAFLAAGLLKPTFDRNDLATLVEFPTDPIVVVNLTGAEIRQALERSVSLYPQSNTSFLQLSGVEASFRRNGLPNERVTSVTVNGQPLQDGRTYTVAMPANLGRGGLGYFKIWNKGKIARTLSVTLEGALKGKRAGDSAPRWSPQG